MVGVAAFSVDEFVEEPALCKLDNGRKADLFAIADHYGIPVSVSLLKELKAAVVEGLVERGVCSLPAPVAVAMAVSAGEVPSEFRGGGAIEPRAIFIVTPGAKRGDMDEKQFTLPRFDPLSVETTPGSRMDAR